jgi:hypothetical protein
MYQPRLMLAGLTCLAAMVAVAACSPGHAPTAGLAGPAPSHHKLTVTSTLDGHTDLPHRIHWQVFPHPAADVTEVDFLIDGKRLWVEHNPPYFYGDDGNYLVTSFLRPGPHAFTVRVLNGNGQAATDTVTATVTPAPAPPAALSGTWKARRQADGQVHYTELVISSVGWYEGPFPAGNANGNLEDVAYLNAGLVEIRTGMATGHDLHNGAASDNDLNGWCNDAPGSPARYRWTVSGNQLRFTFAGGHPCPGFTPFLTHSPWTRVR